MATRKLQTEIDKVLKKVAEGIETFEETLEKIETTTNANQKEKYESDLKKDIKKLQRQRDQIKTWISSNDIKDKRALMENRKLIEQQMEKFKVIEKEMKTKAYSREGLIMSGRLDPKEKEKADLCAWVTERVESLNMQIEAMEAEVETLQTGSKKGKNNPARERISELEDKIERHKWHQGRLELILRLLENGQIDLDKVTSIQEDVNYYVDENQDPDFAEDEEIYTDLNLEEEEDYYVIGADDHHKDDDVSEKDKDEELPAKKPPKTVEPEPAASPARTTTTKTAPMKKLSISEPKETKPAPAPAPTVPTATATSKTTSNGSTRQTTIPRPADTPTIQYATAAAANLPMTEPSQTSNITASPSLAAAIADDSSAASKDGLVSTSEPSAESAVTPASAAGSGIAPAGASATVATPPMDEAKTQSVMSTPLAANYSAVSSTTTAKSTDITSAQPSRSQSPDEKFVAQEIARSQQQQELAPSEPEIRLPSALADLAHSFEISKERALSKDVGFFAIQMLETSFQFLPEAADTERPKYYAPKNPYPTPSYYPQMPPPALFETSATFEKFDIDTLFFIFYYQQGTYQQYLAARELKKQSWRFHKKYLTWFQRHEEPKAITDDYEQGTYIYFDYEGAWCQRKKTDFRFEYKFLEDELV
ncbi:proteinral negative regulator of transcription subunit 5 [Linnemannia schmuckeri]|uniref:General negative regulator of transcription subunit n=1 Tax=Linnemannia schmuckeri TaxID=64567 RepID=A0A9P5VBU2_9FUNG|nr:proteinral negative regulator of transcription subunit 5 [Linnemannia schmuckeri]